MVSEVAKAPPECGRAPSEVQIIALQFRVVDVLREAFVERLATQDGVEGIEILYCEHPGIAIDEDLVQPKVDAE